MKKIIRILSGAFGIFVLCALMFSLSSKADPNNLTFEQCANLPGDDTKIQLYFPGGENRFRNSGYEAYVPSPDLRNGDFPGAGDLVSDKNYYCSVVVTTPGCSNWEYRRVFDSSNGNSNGLMNIKIPPDGYDTVLEVTYFERVELAGETPNFNKLINGGSEGGRVKFIHKATYFNGWSPSVTQPIDLIPVQLVTGTVNGDVNKSAIPDDFGSVNDFLDNEL